MDYAKESLKKHAEWRGKVEMVSRVEVKDKTDLSLAYTPGVAEPCLEIQRDYNKSFELTRRWNTVAVVTDGTAVLGLGDIGPEAGMPVMEGKAVLFKTFGDVDAIPLCVRSKNVDDIVNTVKLLAGSFGGVNLEDISSPNCFYIEETLEKELDIPVFHDDQHGTAIVVVSALINAFKLTGRKFEESKFVLNGAGAAGQAITHLIYSMGGRNIILCDRMGAIYEGRKEDMNPYKDAIAKITNPQHEAGQLKDVIKDADVFIGVSVAGAVTQDMVRSMKKDPIVMGMANPTPEIMPDEAYAAGARIVCTGRSDYPNQVNNLLAFPGIFRGALDVRAKKINEEMKMAAAKAIADLIDESELDEQHVITSPFDPRVAPHVAAAVADAAIKTGVARITDITPDEVAEHTRQLLAAEHASEA